MKGDEKMVTFRERIAIMAFLKMKHNKDIFIDCFRNRIIFSFMHAVLREDPGKFIERMLTNIHS